VSRLRQVSPWILGTLAGALAGPAFAQNLDAGKPAAQIFSEVCAGCHHSVRELKNNASAGFLREHYTTGSDMASTMASYLASVGSDPRAGLPPPPAKRQPAPAATPVRDTPPADAAKDSRHLQQAADPKLSPGASPQVPPGPNKLHPGMARADASKPAAVVETKPPAPPAPVLDQFEE
jgi:hypothetical protein